MFNLTLTWGLILFAWANSILFIGLLLWLALRRRDSDAALMAVFEKQHQATGKMVEAFDRMFEYRHKAESLDLQHEAAMKQGQTHADNKMTATVLAHQNRLIELLARNANGRPKKPAESEIASAVSASGEPLIAATDIE